MECSGADRKVTHGSKHEGKELEERATQAPESKRKKNDLDLGGVKCNFYVLRKKRYCKMTVGAGKEFCGEHEPVQESTSLNNVAGDRVPCPLDSKHTVSVGKLQKHLKVCNARPPTEKVPYIVPGANSSSGDEKYNLSTTAESNTKLSDIPAEQLTALIKKVNLIYETNVGPIQEHSPRHSILENELITEHYGPQTIKHLTQSSAILGLLQHYAFLENDTVFVEFGAGKGQVSYWLARIIEHQLKNCKVLLIDRASLRHKKDNKIEDREIIQRVRADIADLMLGELEIPVTTKQLVGVGKHLCGSATDLALRCIVKYKNSKQASTSVRGCLFALCCHHRCDWKTFVGKRFMLTNGIGPAEFECLVRMVSWAVCGTGRSRERRTAAEAENEIKEDRCGLTRVQREEIGRKCKRILDVARIEFMQAHSYKAHLNYYVKNEITLENVSLFCVKK